jgi:hypothetical protein
MADSEAGRPQDGEALRQEWAGEGAEWDEGLLDGAGVPARAGQFHITDPQKWLDLCA